MIRWMLLLTVLISLAACGGADEPADDSAAATDPTLTAEPEPSPEAETATPEEGDQPTGTSTPVAGANETATPEEAVEPTGTPTPEEAEPAGTPTEEPAGTGEPFDPAAISLSLEPVVAGFAEPLGIVTSGDGSGRLFVVEKGGRIRVVDGGEVLSQPFLDISGNVSGGYEQGLLGLAFEPGRTERFYINYTNPQGTTIISRWNVSADNPNVADPASEEVLLEVEQPAPNHNGGHLVFGPDDYLWIGLGDGGAAGDRFRNGQNAQTILGTMVRIDVSPETGYGVPPDNPYVNGEGADENWAIGLRNPWRFSFDRETDELWIADVGQNAWEEINRAPSDEPGLNYGWPIMEATHCYQTADCSSEGVVLPVTEYPNNRQFGCSVTGGHVYRGTAFPSLVGGYFFADFCSGLVFAIPADVDEVVEPTVVLESGLQISSFGEDEDGEIYVAGFGDGTIYRLVAR